ncbi:aminodeoxychorismate/anthranilate synthase component II [candidate division KSB1 bacterium]|nr:aminodeoxychorismate/anthranilate synthase component II [candidate division KSB1 bacterium]
MILVIDNYDSFTYNLVQYIGETGTEVLVRRNDAVSIDDVKKIRPDKIVLSPGPGRPENSGICPDIIRNFGESIPTLGVCLGHQVIGQVFGAEINRVNNILHGKTSRIFHDSKAIYSGIENPFIATRYHSLTVERKNLPDCLTVSSESDDGTIMGIRHNSMPLEGVQFHPESILTKEGKKLLLNFLSL